MIKHLVVISAVATSALALPLAAVADEASHPTAGEQGWVFHDPATGSRTAKSEQARLSPWRLVGGEAVWIFEPTDNRASLERSRQTNPAPDATAPTRTASERQPPSNGINGVHSGS